MTAATILAQTRRLLGDTDDSCYRWGTPVVYGYIDDAFREAYRVRPDLKLQTNGTIAEEATITSGVTILIPDTYANPIAYRAAGYALSEDGTDEANEIQAQQYTGLFNQGMAR